MAGGKLPGPRALSPRVVVVGGGFAGIEVAKALEDTAAQVTVLDRRNYMLFQPLLYQVATAALSPGDVAVPIRSLLHAGNVEVLLEEVTGIDLEGSRVCARGGRQFGYELLVLATGSQFNYFGHADWAELAPAPKDLTDALEIRRRLLLALERAEIATDAQERRALLTVVIVGGGATGVEMAGAVCELTRAALRRDFHRVRPADVRIVLVEAGTRMLNGFSEPLGSYARRVLERMGVEVLTGAAVERLDEGGVLAGGRRIEARTVIWGAGVTAGSAAAWLGVAPAQHGAVPVAADFSLPGRPEVFVIGDAASARANGRPLPGLAAVAKQEGRYVGQLIRSRLRGDPRKPRFVYRDYGTMATIGRHAAVADLRGFRFTGTLAWLLWGAVHVYFLIGFRNRVLVLINWLWVWATHRFGARLITDPQGRYAQAPRRS